MSQAILLSALLVVHNEEERLSACLEHLDFCDEIVVVLDKCSDNSETIAKDFKARIFKGSWDIEGERRNFGRDQCRGQWILEIDADEHVPALLAEEIGEVIRRHSDGFFSVPVENYVGDVLVLRGWGGSWGKTETACLSGKDSKQWGMQRVHPTVQLQNYRGACKYSLIHYAARDLSDLIRRFDNYTTLRAQDLNANPQQRDPLYRDIRRVFSRFLDCYIRLGGFREGGIGFVNAVFAGLYPIISRLKADAMQK